MLLLDKNMDLAISSFTVVSLLYSWKDVLVSAPYFAK